eukprot:scaffold311088_cov47-Prasinocladus_malaysianus.AAC.1
MCSWDKDLCRAASDFGGARTVHRLDLLASSHQRARPEPASDHGGVCPQHQPSGGGCGGHGALAWRHHC